MLLSLVWRMVRGKTLIKSFALPCSPLNHPLGGWQPLGSGLTDSMNLKGAHLRKMFTSRSLWTSLPLTRMMMMMMMMPFLSHLLCAGYCARSWGQKDKQGSQWWVTVCIEHLPSAWHVVDVQQIFGGKKKVMLREFKWPPKGSFGFLKKIALYEAQAHLILAKFGSLASDVTEILLHLGSLQFRQAYMSLTLGSFLISPVRLTLGAHAHTVT